VLKIIKNETFLASLGASLEYYDFIIFGHLASILSTVFFAGDNLLINTVYAYSIFSVAYLFRPLGGAIAGLCADKFGLRSTFVFIMLLMAFSTLAIGCLPSYQSIGIIAPIILIFLRILQGMSFGAEMPTAINFVNISSNCSSFSSSILCQGAAIGALGASFVMYLLTLTFNHEQILAKMWRLPFMLGGLLAIFAFQLRNLTMQRPQKAASRDGFFVPLVKIITQERATFISALLLAMLPSVLIISYIYLSTYLSANFNYSMNTVYAINTLGLVWCIVILPVFGKFCEHVNKVLYLAIVSLITAFGFYLLIAFKLFNYSNFGLLLLCFGMQASIAAYNSAYYVVIGSMFSASTRGTGVALTYNCAFLIASFFPALITKMRAWAQEPMILFWCLTIVAILNFFNCMLIANKKTFQVMI